MEERIAAYDARRAQRVLNVERRGEAADALIEDALVSARTRIVCQRVVDCGSSPDGYVCPSCRALAKIQAALKALGK